MSFQQVQPNAQGTVLERIVRARQNHLPEIRALAGDGPVEKSTRSLYDALGAGVRGQANIIMECKAASPSLGLIRDPYDPVELARIYSRYANAISVLCEPDFFGGDLEDLAAVSMSTHLPVLCKDFIIDPAQLIAARRYGADAALLMLSVLDDDQYRELAGVAADLGLDVLTEAATDDELDRALALGAKIIGINHRNLHDLSIDITRSRRMAPRIPDDVVIVPESGIRSHATLREIAPAVSAFLVGSQLTSQPDVDRAARELLFGDTKVCGLTSARAARAAYAAGATFGGFIMEPSSPRHVNLRTAASIARAVPGLRYVLVTRDTDPFKIATLASQASFVFSDEGAAGPHAIQIHGPVAGENGFDEAREIERLEDTRPMVDAGIELWRALDLKTEDGVRAAAALAPYVEAPADTPNKRASQAESTRPTGDASPASDQPDSTPRATPVVQDAPRAPLTRLVLDSGGGTGQPFNWDLIPKGARSGALLAGGIGPENASDAMKTGVAGLDLNSKVEYDCDARRGAKDPRKICAALQAIRRGH